MAANEESGKTGSAVNPMRWVLAAAVLLVVAGGGFLLWQQLRPAPSPQAAAEGDVPIGGPFELVDHTGETVTQADFAGKPMLLYFGYTFCPDICPTSLHTASLALDALGDDADKLSFVFVTVDPERDTVEQMAEYVDLFHPSLVGLTGSREQVDAAAEAYRVYFQLHDSQDPEHYLVDHSTFLYVMSSDNRYITHFGHDTKPDEMAAALRELLNGATS
ncbi:MAG: SCO family protein [Geminicoccaceae bacterium]